MTTALLFFVKEPVLGKVKTRLAKSIGDNRALMYYRHFVEVLWQKIQHVSADVWLCHTPNSSSDIWTEWLGAQHVLEQKGHDLGERLHSCFRYVINQGYQSVMVVGSDSPDLPVKQIYLANEHLKNKNVVIGVTEDGGYYLIGVQAKFYDKALFDSIEWSSKRVFAQTLAGIHKLNLSFKELRPWYDIDTVEDLERYLKSLRKDGDNEV